MSVMWKWAALALFAVACGHGENRQEQGVRATGSGPSRDGENGARKSILFVGTSLTAGYGIDPQQAYPALIQRRIDSLGLSYDAINAGVSGETSAGALHRMDWLLRQPVDVFVLETGANDGLRGLDVDSTGANLRAIVAKVKAARPDARILLAPMEAPPNLGAKYTAAFSAMYQNVARDAGVGVIPFLLRGVAGDTRLNQQDGIHPNERGAQIVADNVWQTLGPLLQQLDATPTAS
jgi:acyl-CoA thioesterase I